MNANRANLLALLRKHNPDIVLLNETWLKSNYNFSIKNYSIVRQDRDDGYGGIATCIKNNILFSHIKSYNDDLPQYIVIKISDLNIINIIIPLYTPFYQSIPNITPFIQKY